MVDPVRPLVAIVGGEALAAVVLTVAVAVSGVRSDAGPGEVGAEVVLWVLVVAGLGMVWLGLYRRRRLALSPFLLAPAFGLVVAWGIGGSDVWGWRVVGGVLGVSALAGLVLGLRAQVRQALH